MLHDQILRLNLWWERGIETEEKPFKLKGNNQFVSAIFVRKKANINIGFFCAYLSVMHFLFHGMGSILQ